MYDQEEDDAYNLEQEWNALSPEDFDGLCVICGVESKYIFCDDCS